MRTQNPRSKVAYLGRRLPPLALLVPLAVLASSCGNEGTAAPGGVGGAIGTGGVSAGTGGGALSGGGGGAIPGAGGASAGGSSSSMLCRRSGEPCNTSLDCCDDSTCNSTAGAPELNGCHPRCTQNTDCTTGCCVLFSNDSRGICADAKWCSCGAAGARCGSSLPKCCADQTCLAGDAQQSFYECKKHCTANADCPTNCCVPIPSLNLSACLAPSYCVAP
jgi:hypothetical protein